MIIKNKRKTIIIICIFMALIAAILYKLADRYLFQHVEYSNALGSTSTYSDLNNTSSTANDTTTSSSTTNSSTPVYDDWNYEGNGVKINIDKKEEGSGSDKITYYVADVEITDSASFKSALANDAFGQNILENTSDIAKDNNAIFAVNGDYYGFRSDGIVIKNGILLRDEPTRTGLAIYNDGSMKVYDETKTSGEELLKEGVVQTLSFGPSLVENSKAITDFGTVNIDKNFGNNSIDDPNPRTGIGMISENHFVFIVVDGRNKGYSRGMTLDEFAQTFEDLGCETAYNLDGGGSSTMYFMGKVVNTPSNKNGAERGTSDILYISE